MKAFYLAYCFVRVRKLFFSLLFWPLLIGLFAAGCQLAFSRFYMKIVTETPKEFKDRIRKENSEELLLDFLYNSPNKLESIKVCRWVAKFQKFDSPTLIKESPPEEDCKIQPLDIVIQTKNPATYDQSKYEKFFLGASPRLHLCQNCTGDIVIDTKGKKVKTYINRTTAYFIISLAEANAGEKLSIHTYKVKRKIQEIRKLKGDVILKLPGVKESINQTTASKFMILIMNIAFFIIISLWLGIKAHKKVLDYFAKNNALLPLVAACGKSNFYLSLWIITITRVAFFLLASLPSTYFIYKNSVPKDVLRNFIGNPLDFTVWIAGIASSLAVLTIISSIYELKERHSNFGILYRYIPTFLWLIGTSIWVVTLFFSGDLSRTIQSITASLPIIGLTPMIISPILKLDQNLILTNALLSSVLALLVIRYNIKWFSAHLEEL